LFTNEITAAYSASSNPSTGVYKVIAAIDTTASVVYDKWFNTSSLAVAFSGSFDVLKRENYDYDTSQDYIISLVNAKSSYGPEETAKFKIFVRERDWKPTIYTVANNLIETTTIQDLYYKIFRLNDSYIVVNYSTGSLAYTKTSYDSNGNYFELAMSNLEKGYVYGVKLATWDGSELKELPNLFKFKVE